ncbi:MAG: 16S rRNA (uracil(1498)-N(3))-methyltransferase [Candidatus Pedobacter colombiensis]|uniref:Ribosomal RNA small subunit methyltransferase E n=1 Tax=Candidatus Pedobacter colombiensis TaxID=3121371 RepID=A0AAJ5W9K6_9SPHI|nr:16S rRNA (uracil(1498)-N(3))-methyltransferase [Pedobacter sp.]WEK19585.1 MAG: 16S rRNA (uracil(1498)-N(3))-methyltransferase [Pedobacter sp.]
MHVFYTPDISSNEYVLNEEESKHCTKVLRLGIGAMVYLIDGVGGLYKAEITAEHKKHVNLHVVEAQYEYNKRNHHLHIAIAPTKNIDRLEWFLEKATEIGIEEITPVICDRSERKIVKEDRLYKVITSAVKQSLQAYHPVLNPQTTLSAFLKQSNDSIKMIAHCLDNEPRQFIAELAKPKERYTILIGPEGDFTGAEIELALQNGYKPLTLGNTRLRTETAALAACFEVNYLNR